MTPPIPQRPMLAPDILRLLRPHILDGAAWSREDCHLGAGVRFDAAAIIGGEVHGFEVKSEADSLARLTHAVPSQITTYSMVCDRVTLVAAPKHVARALAIIPTWWGVLRVTPVGLVCERISERNPGDACVRLARLLWTNEARPLARQHGVARAGSLLRGDMTRALATLPEPALRAAVGAAIPRRPWR